MKDHVDEPLELTGGLDHGNVQRWQVTIQAGCALEK
jgi:hypothetical protein